MAIQRKFTTEIISEQHFSTDKWLGSLYLEQRVGTWCQGSGIGVKIPGRV